MVTTTTAGQFYFRRVRVYIFALAVFELADIPFLIASSHFLIVDHIRVILSKHIDLAAFFYRARQGHAFAERMTGGRFAHHVLAGFECFDGEGRVLVEKISEDYGVHFVGEKLIVIGIGRYI